MGVVVEAESGAGGGGIWELCIEDGKYLIWSLSEFNYSKFDSQIP